MPPALAQPVLAVHISADEDEAARFHRYWQAWRNHLPLEVIVSPYRATVAPLANYIEALHHQRPEVTLTVVVPEVVVRRGRYTDTSARICDARCDPTPESRSQASRFTCPDCIPHVPRKQTGSSDSCLDPRQLST